MWWARLRCRLGFHAWMAWGGETLRDGRGKLRLQWHRCTRPGCRTMWAENATPFGAP